MALSASGIMANRISPTAQSTKDSAVMPPSSKPPSTSSLMDTLKRAFMSSWRWIAARRIASFDGKW